MPEPLFDGLPARAEPDAESLLPYAELLRDLVNRRLYPSGATDLTAPSDDRLFDDALRTVLERVIADRLAALSPAELAAAYRQVCGDEEYAAELDRLAELQRAEVERATRLARMRRDAAVAGRLRLAELEPSEVIVIGLFDPARPDLAARRFADNQHVRPLHRVLQVRMVEPDSGAAELLRDTWTGAVWSESLRTPALPAYTSGTLGAAGGTDGELRPELTIHAPLVFRADDGAQLSPPQIVGYVETLDHTLLLDAP